MLAFIKRNIFLIVIFIFTLTVGFVTFLTFIEKSFIKLNEFNLQILLIVDLALLILFFLLIFLDIKKSLKQDISVKGTLTIHGVSKKIRVSGTIRQDRDQIKGVAFFAISPSDYNIKIPRVVRDKIAKTIQMPKTNACKAILQASNQDIIN